MRERKKEEERERETEQINYKLIIVKLLPEVPHLGHSLVPSKASGNDRSVPWLALEHVGSMLVVFATLSDPF